MRCSFQHFDAEESQKRINNYLSTKIISDKLSLFFVFFVYLQNIKLIGLCQQHS